MLSKIKNTLLLRFIVLTFVFCFGLLAFGVSKAGAVGPYFIPKGFVLEHPNPMSTVTGNFEYHDLEVDGTLFFDWIKGEVDIYNGLASLYARLPLTYVSGFGPSDEDDFDIGNVSGGGKYVFANMENWIFTGGFEVIFPTNSDDIASDAARSYFRDFSYFVDAWTLKPYLIFGAGSADGRFSFQANADLEILLDADDIENDDTEYIVEYGGAVSVTAMKDPVNISLIGEIVASTSLSFEDDITGVYVNPGIRIGGDVLSLGAAATFPFGDDVIEDFANWGFIVDLAWNWGS